MSNLDLKEENFHLDISYTPESFAKEQAKIWLPDNLTSLRERIANNYQAESNHKIFKLSDSYDNPREYMEKIYLLLYGKSVDIMYKDYDKLFNTEEGRKIASSIGPEKMTKEKVVNMDWQLFVCALFLFFLDKYNFDNTYWLALKEILIHLQTLNKVEWKKLLDVVPEDVDECVEFFWTHCKQMILDKYYHNLTKNNMVYYAIYWESNFIETIFSKEDIKKICEDTLQIFENQADEIIRGFYSFPDECKMKDFISNFTAYQGRFNIERRNAEYFKKVNSIVIEKALIVAKIAETNNYLKLTNHIFDVLSAETFYLPRKNVVKIFKKEFFMRNPKIAFYEFCLSELFLKVILSFLFLCLIVFVFAIISSIFKISSIISVSWQVFFTSMILMVICILARIISNKKMS